MMHVDVAVYGLQARHYTCATGEPLLILDCTVATPERKSYKHHTCVQIGAPHYITIQLWSAPAMTQGNATEGKTWFQRKDAPTAGIQWSLNHDP